MRNQIIIDHDEVVRLSHEALVRWREFAADELRVIEGNLNVWQRNKVGWIAEQIAARAFLAGADFGMNKAREAYSDLGDSIGDAVQHSTTHGSEQS